MKHKKKKRVSLAQKYGDDFAPQIRMRGLDYYEKGNVTRCLKVDANTFVAVVEGSDGAVYDVSIDLDFFDEYPNYHCDCPCNYPCKHVYATLVAIDHHEYEEPFLKKKIKPKAYDLQKIIKSIPAKKLKEFIVRETNHDSFTLNINKFKTEFLNYFPKEKYEYFYNNLFNAYSMNKDINFYLELFQQNIKEYLSIENYRQAFLITRAIIESTNNTHNLNDQNRAINLLLRLGMYLRIIYRKSNDKLKKEIIDPWIKKIEENKYYNNIYLEDIILSLK